MDVRIRVLGVPVDVRTRAEVLARCAKALQGDRLFHILTANPEVLLCGARDAEIQLVFSGADLIVPDGVGVLFAARLQRRRLPERIPGVELMVDLCRMSAREGKFVYLVGGKEGVATTAAEQLRATIHGLQVDATAAPHAAEALPTALMEALRVRRPALLFVAYGAPKQEQWIARHRHQLESFGVRVAMGVGGAFDMFAERYPRAPRWMRVYNLEWLWRLMLEPRRLSRIFQAVVVFPLLVIRERIW